MDMLEIIIFAIIAVVIVGAALYSMRVLEPAQNQTVTSTITADRHHIYSVNISDSATVKGGV